MVCKALLRRMAAQRGLRRFDDALSDGRKLLSIKPKGMYWYFYDWYLFRCCLVACGNVESVCDF